MVLEIYLFIDPLNRHCYDAEKTIDKISSKLKTSVSVRFVSMLNIKILNDVAAHREITNFNHELPFNMVLDSKAASFQGKRFGRHFLMDLQRELLINAEDYSDDLVLGLAEQNGLDCDMFREDRRSQLAKKMFHTDQQMAHEMSVKDPSTAVLFNSAVDNSGILIKDYDYQSLFSFCDRSIHSAKHFEALTRQEKANPRIIKYPLSF